MEHTIILFTFLGIRLSVRKRLVDGSMSARKFPTKQWKLDPENGVFVLHLSPNHDQGWAGAERWAIARLGLESRLIYPTKPNQQKDCGTICWYYIFNDLDNCPTHVVNNQRELCKLIYWELELIFVGEQWVRETKRGAGKDDGNESQWSYGGISN